MLKFYIVSTAIAWISTIIWCLALEIDKKKLGIKYKVEHTVGQAIATIIQFSVIISIPIFNVLLSMIAWFKYDEALERVKERANKCKQQ